MSIENVKKLELGIDMSCNCEKYFSKENISKEEEQILIDSLIKKGGILEEEAMSSGDTDVLDRAFDYFFEEENDIALMSGGCESLESEIFQYFSMDQILLVLKEKLEKLIIFNVDRAKHFAGACISQGYFENFRNIFNNLNSIEARMLLFKECNKWIGEDYPQEIEILKQDMEKWNSKQ